MTVKRQNNNSHSLTVDIGAQPPLASCENAFEVLSKIQGEFFSTLGDQVTVKGTSVMFNKVPESEQIQTDSDGKVKWQKWFLDTDISTEMRIVWKCRDASSYAVLLVTFLVLPGCTTVLFNFFKCREFVVPGGKDVSFMYKDYAIDCNGDRYQSMIGYTVFMIMVYPVGIPMSWMTMLWISRETLSSDKAMNREALFGNPKTGHVSFLVESYVPKYYYFEVVECIRRILLTSAIGLADESTPWSAVMGVVISLAFLFVFSEAKPFKQSENSALGILLMYTLVLLFIAALLAKMGAVNSTSPTFAAILMTLIFGALALGLWFSIVGTDPVGYFNGTLGDGKDEDKMDASNAPVKSRLASRSTASVDRPLKEVDVESSITANAAQREAEKETENFTGSFEQVVARLEKLGQLEKQGVITKESFDKQVAILNTQLEESL